MPLDPNWFYSSLAQSAASIVGILAAILTGRLQMQYSLASQENLRAEGFLRQLSVELTRVLSPLRHFVRESEQQLNRLHTELELGTKQFDIPVWYSPFERTEAAVVGLAPDRLPIEKARYVAAPNLLRSLEAVQTSPSAEELVARLAALSSLQVAIPDEMRTGLRVVTSHGDHFVESYRKLLAESAPSINWALWLCLLSLSLGSVVWPLCYLSGYETSERTWMTFVFSVTIIALLAYILRQLISNLNLRRLLVSGILLGQTGAR
jgi:hypothetical protein